MSSPFNAAAQDYDTDFTQSVLGRMQRRIVWNYLDKTLSTDQSINILELNCGTGEDALYLAGKGHKVLATDGSPEMIKVASSKLLNTSSPHPDFAVMDLKNIKSLSPDKYDLIFSDFGGLNCISPEELKQLLSDIPELLNDNGRFIAVVMPRFCASESLYFLMKLKFRQVFRRATRKSVLSNVEKNTMNIWYYNPSDFKSQAKNQLQFVNQRSVGLFIPPSYLEARFRNKKRWLHILQSLERSLGSLPFTATIADHFLIELVRKP